MIAGSRANWVEGWGVGFGGWLLLGPRAGDGWAEATQPNFIWLLKTETLTVEQVKHFHLF